MLDYWRAGVTALRGPLVVGLCLGCFVVGVLLGDGDTVSQPPTTPTQPTAAITDESVNRLAAALEAAARVTIPAETAPTVEEAEEVLDAVRRGEVTVVTPTTVPPVQPTAPSSTATTTTTSTTTPPPDVVRWPTTTTSP